jgi:pycsar effector protein
VETVGRPPDEELQREPLPDVRPEPPTVQDIQPQLDFLYRASETFERAVQFADAKAGGVVLILGIGILDLFRHIRDFLDARDASAGWGWLATIACLVAIIAALVTVLQVGRSLFPRRRPGLGSLFFFGVAATYPSPKEYGDQVWFSRERDLFDTMATQAWSLAGIAGEKYKHLRRAYMAALTFASFWAIARLGLSLSH